MFKNAHVDYCLIEDDNPFVGYDLRYQSSKEKERNDKRHDQLP